MTTQVLFKTDLALKKRVQARMKKEGKTLSTFLNDVMRAYDNDVFQFKTEPVLIPKKSLIKKLDKAHEDYLAGRNISKPFDNAKDFIEDLKRAVGDA
jgi:hypothetical protein